MTRSLVVCALLLLVFVAGCGTTGSGELFVEPSIDRSEINITKVAIVPNRLPTNLLNPEKWRRFNWGVVAQQFRDRGIEVIDYETSVNMFRKSGLPVEDTKGSRDKYAELAEQLGVDAVVVPYYATSGTLKSMFLLNSGYYDAIASFQIYLKQQNDFFARIDVAGQNYYTTGFGMLIGIGATAAVTATGSSSTSDMETASAVSLGAFIAGMALDLGITLRSEDSRWESAFEAGIEAGMRPFFAAIGK